MAPEVFRIGKGTMDERELGPIAQGAQLDAHRRLMAPRAREIAIGVMRPGEDEPLRRNDVEIDTR